MQTIHVLFLMVLFSSLDTLDMYGNFSGLKISSTKTEIIWMVKKIAPHLQLIKMETGLGGGGGGWHFVYSSRKHFSADFDLI